MERNRVPLAVEDYLSWTSARGLKDTSARGHRTSLQFLIDACGDIRVASITAAHIERVLALGERKGWAVRTRNIRMEHIGAFLTWCKQRKLMPATAEPMLGWRAQRPPQRRWLRIPPSEWEALLAAAYWPVERAMVAVGLHLCLRISEIQSLKVQDLHLSDDTIDIVRHKTGAVDTMPISVELGGELRAYMSWYTDRLLAEGAALRSDHYLFPPRHQWTTEMVDGNYMRGTGRLNPSRPMANPRDTIRNILSRAGYDLGAGDREGWHTLRRSGARAYWDILSDQGSDYATRTVQAILGHESAATTEKYLGIEIDRTRRDRLIKGQSIFGTAGSNVVPLRRAE